MRNSFRDFCRGPVRTVVALVVPLQPAGLKRRDLLVRLETLTRLNDIFKLDATLKTTFLTGRGKRFVSVSIPLTGFFPRYLMLVAKN